MVEAEGAPPPAELASRASSAFRLLRHALRHDARDIRLGALEMVRALNRRDLLMSPDEVAAGATSTAAGESPKELVEKAVEVCFAVEDAHLTPTSKQLAMDAEVLRKLARHTDLPRAGALLLLHHGLGMLRIRFAHVWHHARNLLQAMATHWPELVGPPLLASLRAAVHDALSPRGGARLTKRGGDASGDDTLEVDGLEEEDEGGDDDDGEGEEERQEGEGDVNASDLRKPMSLTAHLESAWHEALQPPAPGTESAHFASQLLEALAVAPLLHLAARSAEALASLWRHSVDTAHAGVGGGSGGASGGQIDEGDEEEEGATRSAAKAAAKAAALGEFRGERTARRALLLGFLNVYASVENTKSLAGSQALYTDCTRLIGHADHKIQVAALDVLCKWGHSAVLKYRGQLAGLISDKQFRETLALFPVDRSLDNTMHSTHRPIVLPLLSTILYAKLTQRSGRGSAKNAMAQRRATIFAFFASFAPTELRELLSLVLAPLEGVGATALSATPAQARERASALAQLRPAQLLGVLRSLHDAVAQLGSRLVGFLPELLGSLGHVMIYAAHCICQSGGGASSANAAVPMETADAGADAGADADAEDAGGGAAGGGGGAEEAPLLAADVVLPASVAATLDLQQGREARLWAMKLLALYAQASRPRISRLC